MLCGGTDRALGMNLLLVLMSALSLLPGLEEVFGIQEARDVDADGNASLLFLGKEFASVSNEGLSVRPKVLFNVSVRGSCASAASLPTYRLSLLLSSPLAPAYLGGTHGAVGLVGAGNGGGGGESFMRLFTVFAPGGDPWETDVSIHFFLTWKKKGRKEIRLYVSLSKIARQNRR
jgi:hypothetical protein